MPLFVRNASFGLLALDQVLDDPALVGDQLIHVPSLRQLGTTRTGSELLFLQGTEPVPYAKQLK